MDTATLLLIVTIVLAILAIVGIVLYRQRSRIKIQGPLGTGLEYEGESATKSERRAVETGDIKSKKNTKILDETEKGMKTGNIEAGGDVDLQAKARPQAPKAEPPA